MNKKWSLWAAVLGVALFIVTTSVYAANAKYTFADVTIDGQTVEIEASVKETKKSAYSTCSYYEDDYADYLGYYDDDVAAGDTAEQVLDFCVNHFGDRTQ